MVHLLKEKSKVQWKQKERTKHKPLKIDPSLIEKKEIDFAAELKKLDTLGADAYLAQSKPVVQEGEQIDSLKKKK